MTNLGPLTTAFAPPSSASCATTIFVESGTVNWLQYGPTSTEVCQPPSFNPYAGHYYSPGVCPSGYTVACSFQGQEGAITEGQCCPTGFGCQRADANRSADPFGCTKPITQNTYISLTYYGYHPTIITQTGDDGQVSTTTATRTTVSATVVTRMANDVQVEAYGPIVRRSDGDPAWDGASDASSGASHIDSSGGSSASGGAQSTAEQGSQETAAATVGGGLTAGAKAGIGIGVTIGALLVLAAVFAAYRVGRRQRGRGVENSSGEPQPPPPPPQYVEMMDSLHYSELSDTHKRSELNGMSTCERRVVELA